jgi:hypothetical protein
MSYAIVAAHGLGDWLPTVVTPADARRYIDEVDGGYRHLDASVGPDPNVGDSFKSQWASQFAAWQQFATTGRADQAGWSDWLNTKAVMEQTDRWSQQLTDWSTAFEQAGGKIVGAKPIPPGQGLPGGASVGQFTGLVVAAGVLAAIIVIGPKLPSLRRADSQAEARHPSRRRIAA